MIDGYDFPGADLATLILRRFYPERTDHESTIIRDWLLAHGAEYDRFSFSVRVGEGQAPAEGLEPGVARSVAFSSRRRIDVLAWQGRQPTIVEVKRRVTAGTLGQVLQYRDLLLQELPDVPDPRLVIIGRYSDPETIRFLQSNGVDVFLYEETDADGGARASGL